MRLLRIAFGLALFVSEVCAQDVSASMVGVVVDSSGSAIPGATVVVISTDRKGDERALTADNQGEFVATLLPIGKYSLRAEKPGFKTAVREGIELHVNDKLSFRLEMQVGQVTEQVTVEAEAVTVDLQTVTAEGLISGTEMTELSL